MKHNYIKSMLTALLLLCSSIASAQIEVDGLYYLADGEGLAVVANPSGTKYSGDIVIPESIITSLIQLENWSASPYGAVKRTKTYTFYAEAGGTVSFKYTARLVNGSSLYVLLDENRKSLSYSYPSATTVNMDLSVFSLADTFANFFAF